MATKSILKTIDIKNSMLGRAFVESLEKAKTTVGKEVSYTCKCTEIKGDKIKDFFC